MYGQSPYGNVMGRGMFMQPQMQQMLQMRDQMRYSFNSNAIEEQMNSPEYKALLQRYSDSRGEDIDAVNQLEEINENFGQMLNEPLSTEQSLEQLGGVVQQMQFEQQRLAQHLGAGSGMLQQQGGLGGLYRGPLKNDPYKPTGTIAIPAESQRLRTFQGNPFGG